MAGRMGRCFITRRERIERRRNSMLFSVIRTDERPGDNGRAASSFGLFDDEKLAKL